MTAARATVALTAVTMVGLFATQALLPEARRYDVVTVATINQRPDVLGIADSDIYWATPDVVEKTLDKAKALGVRNIRVFIPWYDVEKTKGVYDWSRIDQVIASATKRDLGVVATMTHAPAWAIRPGDALITSPPADPATYATFASRVASRFAGRISAYEVWNEPNGAGSFSPVPDAARYVAILKAAYTAIKAVDKSATVIGGVTGAVPTKAGETIDSPTFLTQMYAAGARSYFDAIAFHPYQYSTMYSQGLSLQGSPLNEVRAMRDLMAAKGDGAKLIWATEYGLPTSVVTEAQQAAYIADFINAWSAQTFAGPMFVYTTRDKLTGSSEKEDTFGVYRDDWSPKAAAQKISDFIATHPQVQAKPLSLLEMIMQAIKNFFAALFGQKTTTVSPTVVKAASVMSAAAPSVTVKAVARVSTPTVPSPTIPTSPASSSSAIVDVDVNLPVSQGSPTSGARLSGSQSASAGAGAVLGTSRATSMTTSSPSASSSAAPGSATVSSSAAASASTQGSQPGVVDGSGPTAEHTPVTAGVN